MNLRKHLKMTLYIDKAATLICAAFFASLTACGGTGVVRHKQFELSSQEHQIVAERPEYLRSAYKRLFAEGKRNEVLNLLQIGKKALSMGDLAEAEIAFEQAISKIEVVYANNEQAKRARSLWYEEGSKIFKGEPYERSMAYFYRGLIYLTKNEFDNARATFISGLMQDAFAEEEQYRSDFALLLFMAGWSARLMGSDQLSDEAFSELQLLRPDFNLPGSDHDTLIIAETGTSPRKLADGLGHYQLVYRRGKNIKSHEVVLKIGNRTKKMYPMEDIFWQASSRGGRPVDAIIEGKARFMKNAATFGTRLSSVSNNALVLSGGIASSRANNQMLGLSLIGVAALAMSSETRPRADTRFWDNLPDLVHLQTLNSNSITSDIEFQYVGQDGKIIRQFNPIIDVQSHQHSLFWSESGENL